MGAGDSQRRLTVKSRDEIGQLGEHLNEMANNLECSRADEQQALQKAELSARESYVIAKLLQLSIEFEDLQEYLNEVLDVMLSSIYWLEVLPKAAIFITEEHGDGRQLRMSAEKDLSPELLTLCERLEFGHCLCGRAAEQQEIVFANCIDHRHDITFDGIQEHGHYSIPILGGNKTLGVIVFYIPHGHQESEQESSFLSQIAHVLSVGISRYYDRESLIDARKESDKANLAKDEFLASMSHELRTPLTSIIGHSELLMDSGCSQEDAEKILHSIHNAGANQLALVNDILDMSKIESGKFAIDETPYDLSVLLRDVKQMFTVRAEDAGIQFVLDQKHNEQCLLMGDVQRLSQILINLIGNAIKFTEQGEVKVTVWMDGGDLYFQVKDSGIGMSEETLSELFQRFHQADGSISRQFGGSGLGLYISENLADLMGGRINVSSRYGVGSIFELVIPYQPTDTLASAGNAIERSSIMDEQLSGHVLVAEDTPELQLLEQRILESIGLSVTVVEDGEQAVWQVNHSHYDLVLMDMQMPVMDGIEATKTLRAQGHSLPIIALTANVMQKHRDAFNEAGCDGFLGKPIDKNELRKLLRQHLQHKSANATQDVPEEVDEELMEIFRKSASNYNSTLKTALDSRDWEELRKVAHTVKGSAASFGFSAISQKAGAVQIAVDDSNLDSVPELADDLLSELHKIL